MIATLVVRFLQLLFGVVVLGISVTAIKWQVVGHAPATTVYGAFCGGFGALAALIGAAVIFIDAIPDLIMAAVDGLAAILFLAGGIAFAVGLKGVHCGTITQDTYDNPLLSGGCFKYKGETQCAVTTEGQWSGHCKKIEADTAFLFLGFVASIGVAVLCFLSSKRGGGRHSAV